MAGCGTHVDGLATGTPWHLKTARQLSSCLWKDRSIISYRLDVRGVLPNELSTLFEGLLGFWKEVCENLPYMRHALPTREGNVHTGFSSPIGGSERVIQEHLGFANLYQQRR